MEEIGEFIIGHPEVTGAVLAALVGVTVYRFWQLGVRTGEVRIMTGGPRAVSEALGG
jgi:hypothetical protein